MIEIVTLRDSYKDYKNSVSDPVGETPYFKITGEMFKFIMGILWAGSDVELGGGQSLGTIGIRGTKACTLTDKEGNPIKGKTDWKQTYILWNKNPVAKAANERIYHLNDHSNGITYHYYWWTEGIKIGYKRIYSFKFAKGNKRMLKKLILEGKEWLLKVKRDKNGNKTNVSKKELEYF